MLDIRDLIKKNGGIKKFSEKYNMPYRTAQQWSDGKSTPSGWLVEIFYKYEAAEEATKQLNKIFNKDTLF